MMRSETASTLSKSRVLWPCLELFPSSPSVSMTTSLWMGSNAAHTPTVQDSCVGEVLKTSLPIKNVWFRVWDLPSPVLPKMDTTFSSCSGLQFSSFRKDVSSLTFERKTCFNNDATAKHAIWRREFCITHLHFLILVNQKKTGDLFQQLHSLGFYLVSYLNRLQDRCLDRVGHSRFGRWRIRYELVFLLIAAAVCAFLTVLTQVNFAVLAADNRPVAFAILPVMSSFAIVTIRDVTRTYLNPLVVLQTLLTVQLELATNTLQAPAVITLERSLLRPTTSITLLTYQTSIDSLFWTRAMPTHRFLNTPKYRASVAVTLLTAAPVNCDSS